MLPVRDGSFSQSLTVEIVGNGYPITMKAIFSILLLVLSAVFYPYQWYLIQVPVISVVSIWVCVVCRRVFLEPKVDCSNYQKHWIPSEWYFMSFDICFVNRHLYQLYFFHIPVVSIFFTWVCALCRRCFLESMFNCANFQKWNSCWCFFSFWDLFYAPYQLYFSKMFSAIIILYYSLCCL